MKNKLGFGMMRLPVKNGDPAEIVSIYKKNGPLKTADFSPYAGLHYHGVPVSAILDTYNTCQFQPNPSYGCDNCYLKNTMAEEAHLDCFKRLPEEKVISNDGTDITEMWYRFILEEKMKNRD